MAEELRQTSGEQDALRELSRRVARLLGDIYEAKGMRLSTLLSQLGFSDEQIAELRDLHALVLLRGVEAIVRERTLARRNGGRLYFALANRYGIPLTDEPAVGGDSQDIAADAARAVKLFQTKRNRTFLETNVRALATALLGQLPTRYVPLPVGMQKSPQRLEKPPVRYTDDEAAQVQALAVDLLETVGRHIRPSMLVHVLYGSEGPRVKTLVEEHDLVQYGALRSMGLAKVKAIVSDLVLGKRLELDPTHADAESG